MGVSAWFHLATRSCRELKIHDTRSDSLGYLASLSNLDLSCNAQHVSAWVGGPAHANYKTVIPTGAYPQQLRGYLADLLFDPKLGLGLEICRYNIGGSGWANQDKGNFRYGADVQVPSILTLTLVLGGLRVLLESAQISRPLMRKVRLARQE